MNKLNRNKNNKNNKIMCFRAFLDGNLSNLSAKILLSLSHAWRLLRDISLSKSEIIHFEFFHFLKQKVIERYY